MDCEELVELATDYVEGALPEEVAGAVRAHLREDADCRRYLDQLQLTTRLLGRLTEGAGR